MSSIVIVVPGPVNSAHPYFEYSCADFDSSIVRLYSRISPGTSGRILVVQPEHLFFIVVGSGLRVEWITFTVFCFSVLNDVACRHRCSDDCHELDFVGRVLRRLVTQHAAILSWLAFRM